VRDGCIDIFGSKAINLRAIHKSYQGALTILGVRNPRLPCERRCAVVGWKKKKKGVGTSAASQSCRRGHAPPQLVGKRWRKPDTQKRTRMGKQNGTLTGFTFSLCWLSSCQSKIYIMFLVRNPVCLIISDVTMQRARS
jgi:hypothetical protein